MAPIVERLRYAQKHGIFRAIDDDMHAGYGEAADHIEAQQRKIDDLVAALGRISRLTPVAANASTALELHYSVAAIAETALASATQEVK